MPDTPKTILILGGTREAADEARRLVDAHPTWRIITSLAGRTEQPELIAGQLRIGGFGGTDGLYRYLTEEHVDQVVDATHPFALSISTHAKRACERAAIPLRSIERDRWQQKPGDLWTIVFSVQDAVDALPMRTELGRMPRVFLALGRQHIAPFAARTDVDYVVRMVDQPGADTPLAGADFVIGKPSEHVSEEEQLFLNHRISHLVCRHSGGARSYPKIAAARNLNLPVIMIDRTRES